MTLKTLRNRLCLGLAAFGLAMVTQATGSAEIDSVWLTVQDDSGHSAPGSIRGQVSGPQGVLRKEIVLAFDPAQVVRAQVQYEMKIAPYYPPTKTHYTKPEPDIDWGEMLILVNGREVARKPGIELASLGWHSIEFAPELLLEGANTITFTWASSPGYFYLAIDNRRTCGRSASSNDGGRTFTSETLSPGKSGVTGEYMVRLRLAVRL